MMVAILIATSDAAQAVESALMKVFQAGQVRTRDIGGTAKTMEFTDAVIAGL